MAQSVRDSTNISRSQTTKCKFCEAEGNLKVCARCKSVAYCSKEHQTADWRVHKKLCKQIVSAKSRDVEKMGIVTDRVRSLALDCQVADVTSTSSTSLTQEIDGSGEQCDSSTKHSKDKVVVSCLSAYKVGESETSDETCKDAVTDKEEISGSSEKFILESEETELNETVENTETKDMRQDSTMFEDTSSMYMNILQSRNVALSEYVTKCLNAYGVCVIDNFLGESKGTNILQEAKDLYDEGDLSSGQLVNTVSTKGNVRGDVISWVNGSEKGCENISTLISSIDSIMLRCRKSLGHYSVKGRSKVRKL